MGSVSFESKTPNMIKILVLSVLLAIVAAETVKENAVIGGTAAEMVKRKLMPSAQLTGEFAAKRMTEQTTVELTMAVLTMVALTMAVLTTVVLTIPEVVPQMDHVVSSNTLVMDGESSADLKLRRDNSHGRFKYKMVEVIGVVAL